MKKLIYSQQKIVLLFVVLSLLSSGRAWGQQEYLTVFDNTDTDTRIPFYGLYADWGTRCQFIIPASELEDMDGASIQKLTFYSSKESVNYDQTVTVYMKEVDYTTFASAALVDWSSMTVVYANTIRVHDYIMEIELNTPNYIYGGGNLMIGFQVTAWGSECSSPDWSGKTHTPSTDYTAVYQNATSGHAWTNSCNGLPFIPKTTFTYTPSCRRKVTISTATITCLGSGIELAADADCFGGSHTYSWSASPSTGVTWSPNNTSATVTATPSEEGEYTFTCSVTESEAVAVGTVTVSVLPAPTISFPGTYTFCGAHDISAEIGGTCGTIVSYQWSNGLGTSPTCTVSTSGNYLLTVTSSNYKQYDLISLKGVDAIVVVAPTATAGKAVPIYNDDIGDNEDDGIVANDAYPYLQKAIKLNGGNTYTGNRSAFKIPADASGGVCSGSNNVYVTINEFPVALSSYDYIWKGGTAEHLTDWNTASNWYKYDGGYSVASSLVTNKNYYIGTGECLPDGNWPILEADVTADSITIAGGATLIVPAGRTLNIKGSLRGTLSANNDDDSGNVSAVVFSGSDNQKIYDAQTFRRVTFAQTTDNKKITAPNGITVNTSATFTKGIVVGDMTFAQSATVSGANTLSFVDGKVSKTMSGTEFKFPTGNGAQFAQFDAGTGSGANVSVRYRLGFTADDGTQMPDWWEHGGNMGSGDTKLDHVSGREHWLVSSSANLSSITLHWSPDGTVHSFESGENLSKMRVAYADKGGFAWTNAGGTASGDWNGSGSISANANVRGTRAISERFFSFASTDRSNLLLPIELTSFTATCDGRSSFINWQTASEKNNEYFLLERSDDAINFAKIARIHSAAEDGNSIEPLDYSYMDYGVHAGDNYYRLWQVDYDGTRTASEIIVANCVEPEAVEPDVLAYPNPFSGELTLVLDNFGNRPARIEVYDMLGRLIFADKVESPQNKYQTVLNFSNLSPAAYNIRVSTVDFVINKNVIKS